MVSWWMQRVPIEDPPDPVQLLAELREHGDAFLLQSAEGPRRLARYSFLGFQPRARLRIDEDEARLDGDRLEGRPADAPRRVLDGHRTDEDEGYAFNGGLVGYLGYEYAAQLEDLPRTSHQGTVGRFPDAELGLFLDGVIYDHERRSCFYFTQDEDRSHELPLTAAREGDPGSGFQIGELSSQPPRKDYTSTVADLQDYVQEGHSFQTVLSRSFEASFEGSPVDAYEQLLAINPSPYMFFLSFDDRDVFGASPEMLVRVEGDRIETDPIAGTRPLGDTPAQTRAYEREMVTSEKERAEHAMLVDLARNDVGKVAQPGTVEVEQLMQVERYSHVQHMVSRVAADLAEDEDGLDALQALFPAGTVSGAPKVRSMELIAELERQARGPYAGCIGYLGLNGNVDSAITIRSAWAQDGTVEIRAGAGIVADSDPEREFEETEAKGEAMLDALAGKGGWT
jgi:anthranilate synthase component 1